jgi:hypothetical protein
MARRKNMEDGRVRFSCHLKETSGEDEVDQKLASATDSRTWQGEFSDSSGNKLVDDEMSFKLPVDSAHTRHE